VDVRWGSLLLQLFDMLGFQGWIFLRHSIRSQLVFGNIMWCLSVIFGTLHSCNPLIAKEHTQQRPLSLVLVNLVFYFA
jgi:hypothetical protein